MSASLIAYGHGRMIFQAGVAERDFASDRKFRDTLQQGKLVRYAKVTDGAVVLASPTLHLMH